MDSYAHDSAAQLICFYKLTTSVAPTDGKAGWSIATWGETAKMGVGQPGNKVVK